MSKKNITSKEEINPIDKTVKQQEQESPQEDIHRVAFNMPKYIYDIVHPKNKKHGLSMTTYIMTLIRKDIGEL